LGSLVCTIQVPLLRSVPPLMVQPDGTPAIVTVTSAPGSVDAAASPRLIAWPAMPAGSELKFVICSVRVAVLPRLSVTVTCKISRFLMGVFWLDKFQFHMGEARLPLIEVKGPKSKLFCVVSLMSTTVNEAGAAVSVASTVNVKFEAVCMKVKAVIVSFGA